MRVAVYKAYGPPEVLHFEEVPTPEPKDNELLIHSRAVTVTSGDCRLRGLNLPRGFGLVSRLAIGVTGPRNSVLGSELAGVVQAVGKGIKTFQVGDEVFAFTGTAVGCHTEYKCVREDSSVAHKPASLSFEEAAALSFGGTTALHFLRAGGIKQGDQVLVNGASGSVGSAAIQLARSFGAEVTGVCSTANLEVVRALGAAHVIDYTAADFASSGMKYDIIMDTAGTAPFTRSRHALRKNGRLLLVLATLPSLLQLPWALATTDCKLIAGVAKHTAADLRFLADLARQGEFRPIVDRTFAFDDLVEAHRYVDAGHKRGNVVLRFD